MYDKVSKWLDSALEQDIPDEVAAFCFNLYEDGDNAWSMELIGAERFNEEDEDWPCDEVDDFETREGLLRWDKEAEWSTILEEMTSILSEYLVKGKLANVLKSKEGVGVGFVDGDINICIKNRKRGICALIMRQSYVWLPHYKCFYILVWNLQHDQMQK